MDSWPGEGAWESPSLCHRISQFYLAPSCAALGSLLCLRLELCRDHFPDIIDCQGDVRRVLVDQHLRELPLHSSCLII